MIISGLVIFGNGIATVVGALFTGTVGLLTVGGLGLGWMAMIEIEELNKQSSKPNVRYH